MFFPKGHRVDFNLRSFVLIGISTKCKKNPVALQRCLNWPKSSACFISLTLISGIPSLWEVLAQQLGANRMQKPAGCSRCYLFLEVHVTKLFNHILIDRCNIVTKHNKERSGWHFNDDCLQV